MTPQERAALDALQHQVEEAKQKKASHTKSTKKTETVKAAPVSHKGDWKTEEFPNGDVLLRYDTGFFMDVWNPIKHKNDRMPCFRKWFITARDGLRVLCNYNKDAGGPGDTLYCIDQLSPHQVEMLIDDGGMENYKLHSARGQMSLRSEYEVVRSVGWSSEYDGISVLILMLQKPKMSLNEIRNVIENEGGSIDTDGIIHKA